MKYLLFSLFLFCDAGISRDPFSFGNNEKKYSCCAIATVNSKPLLALITINGQPYQVKNSDKVAGHEILSIVQDGVILLDEHKNEKKIYYLKN